MRGAWLTVPVLGLVLAAGACGGGDDDDSGDATTTVDCTPVSGNAEIDQDNLQFKPQELCVAAGQKVLFRNSESAIHTVTIDGKNESGNMKKGDTLEWTPPSGGKTYKITCDYHPQMRASVSVVAQ